MPAVRDAIVDRPLAYRLSGGALLTKLPSNFGKSQITLSKLEVIAEAEPTMLTIKVHARITGAAP